MSVSELYKRAKPGSAALLLYPLIVHLVSSKLLDFHIGSAQETASMGPAWAMGDLTKQGSFRRYRSPKKPRLAVWVHSLVLAI
jgi:hypothetical protein